MNEQINHPNHYNREDAMECIDELIQVFGKTYVQHFCLCNVWKYRYRAGQKDSESAIKDFQRQNNLVVDGKCGPCTWEKLLGIK